MLSIYGKYRDIGTYYFFKGIAKMLYGKYCYAPFELKLQFCIDALEFVKKNKSLTVKNF